MSYGTQLIVAGCCLLIGACTTPSDNSHLAQSNKTAESSEEDAPRLMTGSRIPRKSTDRLIKSTDAAGAKEMRRDQAPNPGPRIN
jgi:hypothetical protein